MITTQRNKQTNKQIKNQASKKQTNKQSVKQTDKKTTEKDYATSICVYMHGFISRQLKKLDEISAKTLKTMKHLAKILFNLDIMTLCLLPCFSILFEIQLKGVRKEFMSAAVLANLRSSEPIEASLIFAGILLCKCGKREKEKKECTSPVID